MAHITSLSLENFRVFKEKNHFDFASLTILTGANNAGKSSVLKALLLLADNAQKNDFLELDFSGDKHHLDTFDYTVNKNSESDEISIAFDLSMLTTIKVSDSSLGEKYFNIPPYSNLTVHLTYKKEVSSNRLIRYCLSSENTSILDLKYDLKNGHSVFINFDWLLFKQDLGKYLFIQKEKINELFSTLEKDKKAALISFLNLRIVEYISYVNFDEKEWYKWIAAFKNRDLSSREEDLFKNKLDFDKKWEKEQESYIKKYKKNPNNFSLYEDASYHSLISFFLNANYFSDEFSRLELTADFLVKNTEYEKYSDLLKKVTIKNLLQTPYNNVDNIYIHFESFLRKIYKHITKKISVDYIASFRANSKRLYSNQHQGTEFNQLLLDIHKTKFSKATTRFIESWLRTFNIGESIHFEWIKGVATEVKIKKDGQFIDLVDLGYGITQLLPIILKIALIAENGKHDYHPHNNANSELKRYIAKNRFILNKNGQIKIKNLNNDYDRIHKDDEQFANRLFKRNELFDYKLVLLEEPETNLHPNFQSKLADLLLDASKRFNIQFIIETHSEYLVRKLQYLVATKRVYPKDISLYYFHHPEYIPKNEKQVKKIEFLEDGNLSDEFGHGFFDEADNLTIDLFNLLNQKERYAHS